MQQSNGKPTSAGLSPYLCRLDGSSLCATKRHLQCAICILAAALVAVVVCGAVYSEGRNAAFAYAAACVLASAVAVLVVFYLWLMRRWPGLSTAQYCCKMPPSAASNHLKVSTVTSGLDYYAQVPPGMKSDYPMGPNLVMTLPNMCPRAGVAAPSESDCSAPNTPRYSKRKRSLGRAKKKNNLPPLASMETLTPSLMSSHYGSIDSVV